MSQLNNILNRVTNKTSGIDPLVEWHCAIMDRFGWIPLEEFKQMPGDALMSIIKYINHARKMEAKNASAKGISNRFKA